MLPAGSGVKRAADGLGDVVVVAADRVAVGMKHVQLAGKVGPVPNIASITPLNLLGQRVIPAVDEL